MLMFGKGKCSMNWSQFLWTSWKYCQLVYGKHSIMISIDSLSQYFAVYSLSENNMKLNILLDETITADLFQNHFSSRKVTLQKWRLLKTKLHKTSINYPSKIVNLLQLLNKNFALRMVMSVWKFWGSPSIFLTIHVCWGGSVWMFYCFKKYDDSQLASFYGLLLTNTYIIQRMNLKRVLINLFQTVWYWSF